MKNENCIFESYCNTSLQLHIGRFHKEWKVRGRRDKLCSKKPIERETNSGDLINVDDIDNVFQHHVEESDR